MAKFSLINVEQDFDFHFQEGDQIVFEMPPFCSGDYAAIVKKDPDFGLFIESEDNYFEGCRDFEVMRNGEVI
jgi:hypothetical protein